MASDAHNMMFVDVSWSGLRVDKALCDCVCVMFQIIIRLLNVALLHFCMMATVSKIADCCSNHFGFG